MLAHCLTRSLPCRSFFWSRPLVGGLLGTCIQWRPPSCNCFLRLLCWFSCLGCHRMMELKINYLISFNMTIWWYYNKIMVPYTYNLTITVTSLYDIWPRCCRRTELGQRRSYVWLMFAIMFELIQKSRLRNWDQEVVLLFDRLYELNY